MRDYLDIEASVNSMDMYAENVRILANDIINDYNFDTDDFSECDLNVIRAFGKTIYHKLVMICDYAGQIRESCREVEGGIDDQPDFSRIPEGEKTFEDMPDPNLKK